VDAADIRLRNATYRRFVEQAILDRLGLVGSFWNLA
jgi:hypothetical protein